MLTSTAASTSYRVGDVLKFGEATSTTILTASSVRGNVDVNISDDIKAYVNANATFYDASSAKGNYWSTAASMRPNYPQNAAPLIPIDYISPIGNQCLGFDQQCQLDRW